MIRSKVSIYLPSKLGRVVDEAAERLTKMFGGATVTVARGYYQSEARNDVESISIVHSFMREERVPAAVAELEKVAVLAKDAGEEAVYLTVERNTAVYVV